jgi:hypothetical protein
VTVALIGSSSFNVNAVDKSTLRFGGHTLQPAGQIEDILMSWSLEVIWSENDDNVHNGLIVQIPCCWQWHVMFSLVFFCILFGILWGVILRT